MLQRIQTIYLLFVAVCMLMGAALPLTTFVYKEGVVDMEATGMFYNGALLGNITWELLSISFLCAALALVAIFFYKRRKIQIKLITANIVLIACFYLLVIFRIFNFTSWSMPDFKSFGFGLPMPLIAFLLCLLAIRKIKADEALVRSLDRLR